MLEFIKGFYAKFTAEELLEMGRKVVQFAEEC